MAVKILISFKETPEELAIYNKIREQFSPSVYIKELVKKDLENKK